MRHCRSLGGVAAACRVPYRHIAKWLSYGAEVLDSTCTKARIEELGLKVDIVRTLQRSLRMKRSTARRAAGDVARDRRDWATAEREYSAHLARMPEDQAIWVQYGHSLKEQGKRHEAEAAYRRAIKLRPDDPDAHLQLGHVLKLLGKRDQEKRAYVSSMEFKPSRDMLRNSADLDLVQLPSDTRGIDVQHSADTIYLEVDDLLGYLKAHRTVSGIQRVQVGIITYALAEMAAGRGSYCFVCTSKHGGGFLLLSVHDVAAVLDYIRQPRVAKERLVWLVECAERRGKVVEPRRGQTYLILGAFWGFGVNTARYAHLKKAGVSVGVYIYDLIPVTHPEFCDAGLVKDFKLALGDGLHVFDFILTISEYVATSVRAFIAHNQLRPVPVQAVPLAHQLHDAPVTLTTEVEADLWKGPISPLKDLPFVMIVCTIEPRKNHAYLYAIWKCLVEEGLDPPALVFVGRFGWRSNDFRSMLVDTEFLDGRIHMLHDLSDMDLELLYRSCLFTAFPSIIEGWGLPVGESLVHGRPSIASNTSSIPEVGGNFVDYVDPRNVTGGINVFKRMLFDTKYREKRTRNILKNFVARTWNDVGKDLFSSVQGFRQVSGNATYVPPLLQAGELLAPGEMSRDLRAPPDYARRPLHLILAEGWYSIEPFGCWMQGHLGVLHFKSDCAPGTRIVAYMRLVGAPWAMDHTITVQIGSHPTVPPSASFPEPVREAKTSTQVKPGSEFFCMASGAVEADGTVLVSLRVHGEKVVTHPTLPSADDRVFFVGLGSFAYASASDMELRADLLTIHQPR